MFMSVFLMYRVELKVFMFGCSFATILPVPNVPCGVKRSLLRGWLANLCLVPNVPCGVESLKGFLVWCSIILFLMYRVELK